MAALSGRLHGAHPSCDERKKNTFPFPEFENVTKIDAVIHSCKECEEGKECMYVCFVWTGGGALWQRKNKFPPPPLKLFCGRGRESGSPFSFLRSLTERDREGKVLPVCAQRTRC